MSARPPWKWADRRLNVLQVCDHPGWDGSRMHGVTRLFSWMIPRFDAERFNVSFVSLRRKDRRPYLHGYGASTFGRIAAAVHGILATVHDHANLTDTPWFQNPTKRRWWRCMLAARWCADGQSMIRTW